MLDKELIQLSINISNSNAEDKLKCKLISSLSWFQNLLVAKNIPLFFFS